MHLSSVCMLNRAIKLLVVLIEELLLEDFHRHQDFNRNWSWKINIGPSTLTGTKRQYHTAEAEIFPHLRLDHQLPQTNPTPWLRICPLERLGPHAPPPRWPLAPLQPSFPVAPSLRVPNPRPARQSNRDGRTRRRAQRRPSVSGCTRSAHSST